MTDAPARQSQPAANLPVAGFVLLAMVTLFWGANWPGMKIVLGEIPPWWFRTICLACGGAALLAISAASGNRLRLTRSDIAPMLLTAVFNMIGWHLFSAYGLTLVPAGRASIIAFTMPVWAALASVPWLGDRLTINVVAGLLLGMTGLGVLIGHDISVLGSAPVGALFMLGAAISWGIGTVLFKRFDWRSPIATIIGWQLVLASVPVGAGALLLEPFPDLASLSGPAIIALVYVLAFPMVFCQWAYFKIVRMFPAVYAAVGVLAVPLVGVISSLIVLGEPVGWREVLALILVTSAIFTVLILPRLRGKA
ncbi:MAG: DMT family transporter [Anderseniella sp.]|nr:DMT family transporter [Anderseniella sp.]